MSGWPAHGQGEAVDMYFEILPEPHFRGGNEFGFVSKYMRKKRNRKEKTKRLRRIPGCQAR